MSNHLTLKKFLAEKLTDKIHYSDIDDCFYWREKERNERWEPIKETEWPYIVQLVEGKLTPQQQSHFSPLK